MTSTRPKERELYDEYSDHRVDHSVRDRDFYDKRKERKPTKHGDKFIPRRRGPAKITWPLAPEKALGELTGRGTLAKSLVAYVSFVRTYRACMGLRPKTPKLIREQALEAPWTQEAFRATAEGYCQFPRKGFQLEKQKERISKLFRKLGLK